MAIDKSLIDPGTRVSLSYFANLDEFLDFAYARKEVGSIIYCPCRKFKNRALYVREVVRKHLQDNRFWVRYKLWAKHGESIDDLIEEPLSTNEVPPESDGYMDVDMARLVEDAIGMTNRAIPEHMHDCGEGERDSIGADECSKQFSKLMQCANLPPYPGSKKHTALCFAVRLLQAKTLYGWTNNSFKELLDIFVEIFLDEVNLPKSYYQARNLVDDLGFSFKTVDACPNSCMLFRNEDANLDVCSICNPSRWRATTVGSSSESGTRRAAQQARYFSLTPRLQRMFATTQSTTLMKWHGLKHVDDDVFRHPANSPAWKHLDVKHASRFWS